MKNMGLRSSSSTERMYAPNRVVSALRGLMECYPAMGLPVSEPRLRLAAINTGWRLPSCPMM